MHAYDYSIADILLHLNSDVALARRNAAAARYVEFDAAAITRPSHCVEWNVELRACVPKPSAEARILFETPTWRALQHGNTRLLECRRNRPGSLEWLIALQPGPECTFFFSQLPVEGQPPGTCFHPMAYPPNQVLLIHLFHLCETLLMHGLGFVQNGTGILCVGKSGAGKSTLAGTVEKAGMRVLSDDRIAVRLCSPRPYIYGTPWPGDAGHAHNEGHPLSHLLFLVQSGDNRLEPLSPTVAAQRLMPVCSIPWYDPDIVSVCFTLLEQLVKTVPCAELHFTRDDKVLDALLSLS